MFTRYETPATQALFLANERPEVKDWAHRPPEKLVLCTFSGSVGEEIMPQRNAIQSVADQKGREASPRYL